METNEIYDQKLKRAQRRLKFEKKFYKHLRIFIVANVMLFLFKYRFLDVFSDGGLSNVNIEQWANWNIYGTPIIWGVILGIHAIYVFVLKAKPLAEFKPSYIKNWETEQLEKFIDEEK